MKLFIPLPLILLMPLIFLFYVFLLPFLLIADVVFAFHRKPFSFTRSAWVFIELLWATRGLTVDVKGAKQRVFIKVF